MHSQHITDIASVEFWLDHIPRPTPEQPGSLRQQQAALDVFHNDFFSWVDPDAAWQRARVIAIPHADPAYLETQTFFTDGL